MFLRTIVGIYPFGPTGTQRVLLFLGSFRRCRNRLVYLIFVIATKISFA